MDSYYTYGNMCYIFIYYIIIILYIWKYKNLEKHRKWEVSGSQPFQLKDTQPILYPFNLISSNSGAKGHPHY